MNLRIYDRSRQVRPPQLHLKSQNQKGIKRIPLFGNCVLIARLKLCCRSSQSCFRALFPKSSRLALHYAVRAWQDNYWWMSAEKEQNKPHLKKRGAWLRLFSDSVSSAFTLFSVVVLYTQGVESKQWREVRDHSRSSVNTTQSACLFSVTALSLRLQLPPSYPPLSSS